MTELEIRCSCGTVRGRLLNATPENGNRLACMCDDCQTYAHFLDRPDDILDANGGTEVYQTTPAQLRIDAGSGEIRCLRQVPKGMLRFYAACCNTPIANLTASPTAPFAGLHATMFRHHDPETLHEQLGPLLARTQGRFGFGEMPPDAYERAPFGLILRSIRVLGSAWIARKGTPNPFFEDGEPIVAPQFYTAAERADVEARARQWAVR